MHRLAHVCCTGNAVEIPQPNDPTKKFTCKYDAWNRLVEVRDPGLPSGKQIVAEYRYDAFGRRTLKRLFANGQWAESRHYIYSTSWQLLQEWRSTPSDPEPKVDVHYAWGLRGPDELVQRMRVVGGSNEVLTPLQDDWYNTALLVDQTGQVKERYGYDAYGRCHVLAPDGTPRAASAHDWNILFGGYYYDKETGLYHVRRRTYHPTLGTWLQPDPQGYADGPNLYLYGRGSPVTFVDPSGEAVPLLAWAGWALGVAEK